MPRRRQEWDLSGDWILRQLRGLPRVSRKEARRLLERARAGDRRARARYLDANRYRAARLAAEHCPPAVRRVDAINEGARVLEELVDDPARPDPLAALEARIRAALGAT